MPNYPVGRLRGFWKHWEFALGARATSALWAEAGEALWHRPCSSTVACGSASDLPVVLLLFVDKRLWWYMQGRIYAFLSALRHMWIHLCNTLCIFIMLCSSPVLSCNTIASLWAEERQLPEKSVQCMNKQFKRSAVLLLIFDIFLWGFSTHVGWACWFII